MNDCLSQFYTMRQLSQLTEMVDRKWAARQTQQLNALYIQYQGKGGTFPQEK